VPDDAITNIVGLWKRTPTTEADTINADLLAFLNEPHHATTRGA
jgi:hypothetical protein